MPETTILFYCDEDGSAPVLEWLIKLAHGLTKKKEVPRADILVAIERKERFERDPAKYTYREQE